MTCDWVIADHCCRYLFSDRSLLVFFSSQIRINNGELEYKYYRKEQKKQITLNFRSHHPMKTKVEVARNFYKTASISSSSPDFTEESYRVIDKLLENNGYANPRQFIDYKLKTVRTQQDPDAKTVTLKLPYLSEEICHQILKFIKNTRLPISVVFLPGIKLKELFCASRPYDRRQCVNSSCLICPRLTTDRVDCSKMAPIYKITCNLCHQTYIGESSRSLHDRLSEHLRFANNPTCRSYMEEPLAVHYNTLHSGQSADLTFELIGSESNTIIRKIQEAHLIFTLKPEINDKEECVLLQRFLIKSQN